MEHTLKYIIHSLEEMSKKILSKDKKVREIVNMLQSNSDTIIYLLMRRLSISPAVAYH